MTRDGKHVTFDRYCLRSLKKPPVTQGTPTSSASRSTARPDADLLHLYPWRVRYPHNDGHSQYASVSGFTTANATRDYANDLESDWNSRSRIRHSYAESPR